MNAKSNWTQLGQDIFGEATKDSAGYSLSLTTDGGTVAVGSPFNSGPNRGFSSGQVRLFSFDAVASSWVQNELNMTGVGRNDQFGFFVATSADGETLAMGAPAFEAGRPGYVKVASLKNGQQIGQIIEGKTIEGEFGSAISLSEDGTTIAVSDPDQGNGLGSVVSSNSRLQTQRGYSMVRLSKGRTRSTILDMLWLSLEMGKYLLSALLMTGAMVLSGYSLTEQKVMQCNSRVPLLF